MSEEIKAESTRQETAVETLAEQLQAGHRSRMNGTLLQGLNMNNVKTPIFHAWISFAA